MHLLLLHIKKESASAAASLKKLLARVRVHIIAMNTLVGHLLKSKAMFIKVWHKSVSPQIQKGLLKDIFLL
jgi:hypothetical protein